MALIDIMNPSERFGKHLQIKDNYRIIFSGKFGIGKTYFLNKFFDLRPAEYNKFIVSPTNYVVSSNEDIFELIKADIIKDLFITQKIDLKTLPKDNDLQKMSSYFEENQLVLGRFMLSTIAKISSGTLVPEEIIKIIDSIYSKYKDHLIGSNSNDLTREELLSSYWFETNQKIGHIYEHNYITKLINSILDDLKDGGSKKNVLIIDDLDRVDPEHIFRILNILSAHNNQIETENKFIFDHIIIVCDIENIKRIYQHKYGLEVEFEGYIDKFYSIEYFKFYNSDAIEFYVEGALEDKGYSDGLKQLIILILKELVKRELVTVRQLFKHKFNEKLDEFLLVSQNGLRTKNISFMDRPPFISNITNLHIKSNDAEIFRFFKLMNFIFGDFNLFVDKLKKVESDSFSLDYYKHINLFTFLALQKHIICSNDDSTFFKVETIGGFHNLHYPTTDCFGRKFKIHFKWNASTPYDSKASFFDGARCVDEAFQDIVLTDKGSSKQVQIGEVIKVLNVIIDNARKKNYLKGIEVA